MRARGGRSPPKKAASLRTPPSSERHEHSQNHSKAPAADLLVGRLPDGSRLWAAVDATARFVQPGLRSSRLGARLAPFPDRQAAEAALIEAGAEVL